MPRRPKYATSTHKPAKNPPCAFVHNTNSGTTSHNYLSRTTVYEIFSPSPSLPLSASPLRNQSDRDFHSFFPSHPAKQYESNAKSSVKLTYDANCGRKLQ